MILSFDKLTLKDKKEENLKPEVVVYTNEIKRTNYLTLFAQPIENGFQLIDSTPKVILKIYTTSNPSCFIAFKDNIQGVLVNKENYWYFEYYSNSKVVSEKMVIKF